VVNTVRYFNLVLNYKGNKYKRYKWILALLKLKGLIKKIVKKLIKKIKVKG